MQVDTPCEPGEVLAMFSFYQNAYQGMTFSADKPPRQTRLRQDVETVLYAYLQGQGKAYAVVMQSCGPYTDAVLQYRLI